MNHCQLRGPMPSFKLVGREMNWGFALHTHAQLNTRCWSMPAPDSMNHHGQKLLCSWQVVSLSPGGRRDTIWVTVSHG